MDTFRDIMGVIGTGVDVVGVVCVVVGGAVTTWRFLFCRGASWGEGYRDYRRDLGQAILLGLEFLVAGDIIRTVVVDPTLRNAAVLGVIVVIRTFLSMAMMVEVEGRWPWQSASAGKGQAKPATGDSGT